MTSPVSWSLNATPGWLRKPLRTAPLRLADPSQPAPTDCVEPSPVYAEAEIVSERALPDGVLSGTVVESLDVQRARKRLGDIQDSIQHTEMLITEAIEAQDWRTLGFPDLMAWCREAASRRYLSKPDRSQLVRALADEGHSLRDIGFVLHVSKSAVQRELKPAVPFGTPESDEQPPRVTRPAEEKQAQRDDRKRDIELDRQAKERMAAALAAAELTAKAKEIRQHLPVGDSLGQMLGAAADMQWQLKRTEQASLAASAKAQDVIITVCLLRNGFEEVTIVAGGNVVEDGAATDSDDITRAIAALQRKLLESYT